MPVILQDNAGTPSWYLQDGLGSTVGQTDNSGALTATYSYDVYGAVTSTTGSPAATFTFDGEQTDASGLMYLRARYDDPSTGRFVTRDRFAGLSADPQSLNGFSFAQGNPTDLTDPTGQCPICPALLSGGVGALVGASSVYIHDVASNAERGDGLFNWRSYVDPSTYVPRSSWQTYASATTEGFFVGFGCALATPVAPAACVGGLAFLWTAGSTRSLCSAVHAGVLSALTTGFAQGAVGEGSARTGGTITAGQYAETELLKGFVALAPSIVGEKLEAYAGACSSGG